MNDWALITGASTGIGRELAGLFAADHFNLVLVARNEARLKQVAEELSSAHGIGTKVLARDLAAENSPREIFDALEGTPVSVLVNNAGFGVYGSFAKSDLHAQTGLMQVNMTALVQLTHLFVQPMLARGNGKILNVASIAAFQPGPMISLYYASKAFVYSFSYALADELRRTGVTVTALCPGTTQTEFFARAGIHMASGWPMMNARKVAEAGYRGLLRGRRVVIPGLMNKVTSAFAKRVPVSWTTPVVRRIHTSQSKG